MHSKKLTSLVVNGLDSSKFLQGQLTCDIDKLTVATTYLAAHCAPNGKIRLLLRVYKETADTYLLLFPEELQAYALNTLNSYARFSKVTITPNASHQVLEEINNNYSIWHLNNIKNLIGQIYLHSKEQFLPAELNLAELNAIDFAKGCYTGQEIIARMHYRGKSKTKLIHHISEIELIPGSGHDLGIVVDSAYDQNQGNYLNLLLSPT